MNRPITVMAKLAGMRKPQGFVIYPRNEGDDVMVQANTVIGQFNPVTRQGVINYKKGNYKGFMHLSKFMGAQDYEYPEDFVKECLGQATGDLSLPGITFAAPTPRS